MDTSIDFGKIKTRVICETPVITLRNVNYNGGRYKNIYLDDLKKAKSGDKFSATNYDNCGRDVTNEILTVLVKNEDGVLCHLLTEKSSDEPNPEWWSEEELLWFTFIRE